MSGDTGSTSRGIYPLGVLASAFIPSALAPHAEKDMVSLRHCTHSCPYLQKNFNHMHITFPGSEKRMVLRVNILLDES